MLPGVLLERKPEKLLTKGEIVEVEIVQAEWLMLVLGVVIDKSREESRGWFSDSQTLLQVRITWEFKN